jgi:hypothetical protein
MNWKKAGKVVDTIIKVPAGGLKDRVEEAWKTTGEASKAMPQHYSDGLLTLKVKNSAHLQELTYKKEELKDKLNSQLDIKIKNIKFIFS